MKELNLAQEDYNKRMVVMTRNYNYFKYTLGIATGILKAQIHNYPNVQIVGEYY